MEIEFYYIESGNIISSADAKDTLFVMNGKVYSDNFECAESQEATVQFEDFIKECLDLGWRIITTHNGQSNKSHRKLQQFEDY